MTIRIWILPPGVLDNHRLLAMHRDLHELRTQITTGAIVSLAAHQYRHQLHFLAGLHDMCVVELEGARMRRGKARRANHRSLFAFGPEEIQYATEEPDLSRDAVKQEVIDLRAEWIAEGYYHGAGRRDLRELETALELPPGHDPYNIKHIREFTRKFLKEHRGMAGHSPATRLNMYRQMRGPFAWQLATAEISDNHARPLVH